jgi:hypothetical protein
MRFSSLSGLTDRSDFPSCKCSWKKKRPNGLPNTRSVDILMQPSQVPSSAILCSGNTVFCVVVTLYFIQKVRTCIRSCFPIVIVYPVSKGIWDILYQVVKTFRYPLCSSFLNSWFGISSFRLLFETAAKRGEWLRHVPPPVCLSVCQRGTVRLPPGEYYDAVCNQTKFSLIPVSVSFTLEQAMKV